jgi:hypothetical protein
MLRAVRFSRVLKDSLLHFQWSPSGGEEGHTHRVNRVLGFLSSRPNWVPHTLTSRRSGGGGTLVAGEWAGDPNSDEGTDTVVL